MSNTLDRRSLLRMFGAGAVVVPVVAGMPADEAQVRLIEPPKVELVSASAVIPLSPMTMTDELDVTVYIRSRKTKETTCIECTGFATVFEYELIDVTQRPSEFRQYKRGETLDMTMRLTGRPRMTVRSADK